MKGVKTDIEYFFASNVEELFISHEYYIKVTSKVMISDKKNIGTELTDIWKQQAINNLPNRRDYVIDN